jgi:hypothetical protein
MSLHRHVRTFSLEAPVLHACAVGQCHIARNDTREGVTVLPFRFSSAFETISDLT